MQTWSRVDGSVQVHLGHEILGGSALSTLDEDLRLVVRVDDVADQVLCVAGRPPPHPRARVGEVGKGCVRHGGIPNWRQGFRWGLGLG